MACVANDPSPLKIDTTGTDPDPQEVLWNPVLPFATQRLMRRAVEAMCHVGCVGRRLRGCEGLLALLPPQKRDV